MAWVEHSSTGIGDADRHYSLIKFSSRRQWMLARHEHALHAAAYFRTEAEARTFAATFHLTITDHQEIT